MERLVMNLVNFRLDTDADGIALVAWDMPGRSMNVLTPEVIAELSEIVDHVAKDPSIKGAVITSGKEGFSGGADLTMLQGMGKEYARVAKAEGEEAARASSRWSSASSRPRASRSPRQSTASVWAELSNSLSPATIASLPTSTRLGSACRKSRSACSRAPAARSASLD
jgi:hypothetical protein